MLITRFTFKRAYYGAAAHTILLQLSSTAPRQGSWSSLSSNQRTAWHVLGWNADSWEGRAAPPEMSEWSELSPEQQAAAKYGLGFHTAQEWREAMNKMHSASIVEAKPTQHKAIQAGSLFGNQKPTSTAKNSVGSTLASMAWNVAKAVAPGAINTISDSSAAPVVINDVETTVYLDNSPSMQEGTGWFSVQTRLDQAKKALLWLSPALGSMPCRVLKFSNQPTVLKPRDQGNNVTSQLPQIMLNWNANQPGTYLWKMIEDDVQARYRPGTGKLRLVVITDGEDNLSPHEYQGMKGMDPMMRTLQQAGYDIEWHIIVVGSDTGLDRYQALAGATGGSFLAIPREFDETKKDAVAFRDAVRRAQDENYRRERQRRYETEAKAGKTNSVDWYKQLPPPDKK